MRERLWLVKNGVPFDLAFQLDDTWSFGMGVVFTEFEGGQRFNWSTLQFEETT